MSATRRQRQERPEGTYAVEQLAAGSSDIFLDGVLVASLVREVDRSDVTRGWLVDLLDEMPPAERPAPFTAQQHAFATCTAALDWLGIRGEGEETEGEARERATP